jgi:tetratricopeptide (TPR) repeat protein
MSWDWERAKREFLRAIEIKPSYAPARNFFGQYLHSIEGKAEQAAHQLERAVELDPLNAHSLALLGQFLVDAGRPEEAHAVLLHARELDPTLPHPHSGLVHLFIRQARTDEAVAAAEAGIVARGRDRFALGNMVAALAADGRPIEAEAVLDEMVNLSTREYVNPTLLASAYASIGRRDDAFRWLDRAYRERSVGIALVMSRYWWSGEFFDDPRFHELRKRVGLEN